MSDWNGVPDNSDKEGYHWLKYVTGKPMIALWHKPEWSYDWCWSSIFGSVGRLQIKGFEYLGPCLTPDEIAQHQVLIHAVTNLTQICSDDACSAGLSWSGMNIVGDRKSIDYVSKAIHYYQQRQLYVDGWNEHKNALLEKLNAANARIKELEEAKASDNALLEAYYLSL